MKRNDIVVLHQVMKNNEHVDTAGLRHATLRDYALWRAASDGVQTDVADVAFGNDDVSLSHEDFLVRVAAVQDMFDSGKTGMKTCVVFDQDYLRAMHVVRDGDVDQHTLRSAIMTGCASLHPHFAELQYVGVIQVDTDNVCCDLIMVDADEGRAIHNGSQHGVISASQVREFTRAVDESLRRQADRMPIAAHV